MPADPRFDWFHAARYGLFIHWGPYAEHARGEQVLFREHLDQRAYAGQSRRWNPGAYDARAWAKLAVEGGFRYAVLTTRHHDGYCLWDSRVTDYTSARSAPRRDFVREFVDAFREAGLRVGLYYSLADWTQKAYWSDAADDPAAWAPFRDGVHAQVRELLTGYGPVDMLWFDGAWPHSAEDWNSRELLAEIRRLQPACLVNNRLGKSDAPGNADGGAGAGDSRTLGDFGTPEHHITADPNRAWESCQTSTWRLWGYAAGERWRPADLLLDFLCESASKGGNLLLNVGPRGDGAMPPEFEARARAIGAWLKVHGEAIYGSERGDVTEFVTRGWQTRRGNTIYLIYRFWPGRSVERIAELATRVRSATLLTTGEPLRVEHRDEAVYLHGLPEQSPTPLFPVIRLECESEPAAKPWARDRLWSGDPRRMRDWATPT
jgi:alpha-L-fucosidase